MHRGQEGLGAVAGQDRSERRDRFGRDTWRVR